MTSRIAATAALLSASALVLAGCSGSSGGSGGSSDGEYSPSGTVKMVVAMAAGGGSDRAMRVMSQAINEGAEGYSTVVENREGGGGAVGWSYFYGLAGQPQHLVKAETAIHTLPMQEGVDVPWTYADFTPIALFAEDSRMVVAPADSDLDTCSDLVDSTGLSVGVSGTFGADGMVLHHLDEAGLDADRVPFGSTGEVITGILGGQIDAAPASAAAVKPYVESGDLKALCTLTEERYADDEVLADVPTAIEEGIDATVVIWRGILAAPDISDEAQQFWIDEVKRAVETDEYKDYITTDLLIEKQLYGDEFATYLDEYDAEIQEYFAE
ncbi:tripartite tricarboxylate transporter substrate binding protein [Microbacterium sp. gxy059]|uniref:tripartite tricarboxylate transporter substrate binding protein n=1 Tax=Microbacterium sp. gxy059 TaxID=2957199 RepID=UPI003D987F5A